MDFTLTLEYSTGVRKRASLVVDLSEKLCEHFSDKNYGEDVKEILIGVIVMAPEFEPFTPVRKPKYVFYREYIEDDTKIVQDKSFGYDIKLDYAIFKDQSDDQNGKMLASVILDSLSNLDRLPKKVKQFDRAKFREDVKAFLDKEGLIG